MCCAVLAPSIVWRGVGKNQGVGVHKECIVVEGEGDGGPVLMYGHLDKQPHMPGEWDGGLDATTPVRRGTSATILKIVAVCWLGGTGVGLWSCCCG